MKTLTTELENIIQQAEWPMEHRLTMQSRRIYENGLDIVNSFRGYPEVYIDALAMFQRTNSCPYAYAGIAYTLTIASANDYTNTSRPNFQKALNWLEKSQAIEPDRPEINFIEAVIYINRGQLENGRLVLDHLTTQDARNYYVCLTEMKYWQRKGDEDRYLQWVHQAMEGANNSHRQAFVLNSLANFHLEKRSFNKSIKLFQKVVEIDPDDAWAWHNMSFMLVKMKQFKEAKMCNERALKIMDFGAARQVEQEIKKNLGGLGRLFGR